MDPRLDIGAHGGRRRQDPNNGLQPKQGALGKRESRGERMGTVAPEQPGGERGGIVAMEKGMDVEVPLRDHHGSDAIEEESEGAKNDDDMTTSRDRAVSNADLSKGDKSLRAVSSSFSNESKNKGGGGSSVGVSEATTTTARGGGGFKESPGVITNEGSVSVGDTMESEKGELFFDPRLPWCLATLSFVSFYSPYIRSHPPLVSVQAPPTLPISHPSNPTMKTWTATPAPIPIRRGGSSSRFRAWTRTSSYSFRCAVPTPTASDVQFQHYDSEHPPYCEQERRIDRHHPHRGGEGRRRRQGQGRGRRDPRRGRRRSHSQTASSPIVPRRSAPRSIQPLADVEEEVPKATTMAATAAGESKQEIPSINAVHPFHKIQQA